MYLRQMTYKYIIREETVVSMTPECRFPLKQNLGFLYIGTAVSTLRNYGVKPPGILKLHNRNLHISGRLNEEKVDIEYTKVDIENGKVDIQVQKVDIESVLSERGRNFSVKTNVHIHKLFEKFGFDEVFGRSAVMELLDLKGSGASKLLSNLVQADIIEPVSGYGKGKYKFKI